MIVKTYDVIERSAIADAASRLRRGRVAFAISPRSSGATPLRRQQSASQQIQVGERKACVQASCILHQSAITNLVVPQESLDHVKGVLHAGSRSGATSIDPALILAQRCLIRSSIDPVTNPLCQ